MTAIAHPAYDVFISYKSEDATGARALADALIARSLRVWFAEYEVLPGNYASFDAALVASLEARAVGRCMPPDSPLAVAVRESRVVVAITGERWLSSPFCQMEIEHALARPVGSAGIVHLVRQDLPSLFVLYPDLQKAPRHRFAGAFEDVLSFVIEAAGLRIQLRLSDEAPPYLQRHEFPFGVTIDLDDFMPARTQRTFVGVMSGCPVRLDVALTPFANSIGQLSILESGNRDDRAAYARYLELARTWSRRTHRDVRGLHLFFWNGRSHLAMTTRLVDSGRNNVWERRYRLLLSAPAVRYTGELETLFSVTLPPLSGEESLEMMCALAPRLDRMARSVTYWPDDDMRRRFRRTQIADAVVVVGAVAAADAAATRWTQGVLRIVAAMAAAGLLVRLASKPARESHLGRVHALSEIARRWRLTVVALPAAALITLFDLIARGAIWPASVATWAAGIALGVESTRFWTVVAALTSARGALAIHRRVRHRTIMARDVPGTPLLNLDGSLNELISTSRPRLRLAGLASISTIDPTALGDRILIELRAMDARPYAVAVEIALMCAGVGGAFVASGSTLPAFTTLVAGAIASGIVWMWARRRALPPDVRDPLATAEARASAAHYESVARAYHAAARAGGHVSCWSRAIQWAAAAWQVSATDARRVLFAEIAADAAERACTLPRRVTRLDLAAAAAAAAIPIADEKTIAALGSLAEDDIRMAAQAIVRRLSQFQPT